jgi:hypothetical protein
MMNITQRMECLSRAYIQAVAAYAGFQVSKPDVDDDSIDGIIMSRIGKRPRIEFQLKATSQDVLKADHLAFPFQSRTTMTSGLRPSRLASSLSW